MHSWVGYKLVKVLLIFGLDPKIRDDLEDWSPDLFNLVSYMGNKKRSTKKEEADHLLTILFQKTLHSGYFAKLPFGSKANFEKMPNTILPMILLTWLRQLQEHFYKISDNKRVETGMFTEIIVPLEPNMCQKTFLWTTCT
jgi:hypothetical protein